MQVVVQRIQTTWTRRSRGGSEAAVRVAAPTAFELPPTPPPFLHDIIMREEDDFTPESVVGALGDAGVRLREKDGKLLVQALIPPVFAVPPRPRRPPALRLELGQWLRWQLNYRTSDERETEGWSYHLHTFNVAYGPVAADVFLGTPTHLVDERGHLR